MMSDIAIVILNWNGSELLKRFLPSVLKNSAQARIYVIDNGSTDNSVEVLQSDFKDVQVIALDKNYGFAGGYNEGLKSVKESILCLLNSDVRVEGNWIEPITDLFKNPEIGIIQPKILDEKNPELFEYAGAAGGFIDFLGYPYCRGRLFSHIEKDRGQYDDEIPVFWATGACLFIRNELFKKLKGFDERYFAHQEEIDLCWRAQRIGYQVWYTSKSKVFHLGGSTLSNANPFKTQLNFRNSLLNIVKNSENQLLWLIVGARLILDGVAGLFFLIQGKPKHTLAIIKAHFQFYSRFRTYLRERTNSFNTTVKPVKRAIVFDYYIKGYKK
jgi:GT2 family glycosyltransferase